MPDGVALFVPLEYSVKKNNFHTEDDELTDGWKKSFPQLTYINSIDLLRFSIDMYSTEVGKRQSHDQNSRWFTCNF